MVDQKNEELPPTNMERTKRAMKTLAFYQAQSRQSALLALRAYITDHENPLETQLVDLITDLRHLADQEQIPWSSVRQGYYYKEHPIYGFMRSLNALADQEDLDWDTIMDSADMNHDEEVVKEKYFTAQGK